MSQFNLIVMELGNTKINYAEVAKRNKIVLPKEYNSLIKTLRIETAQNKLLSGWKIS